MLSLKPETMAQRQARMYAYGWARRECNMGNEGLTGFALAGWLDCDCNGLYEWLRSAEVHRFAELKRQREVAQ